MTISQRDGFDVDKAENLGHLLLRAARLFDAMAFERISPRHPAIRKAHLQLMPHLDEQGVSITEMARKIQITKQAVGQLVDDLEAAGYVRRRPHPTDGRAKVVSLTRRGRRGMADGLGALASVADDLQDDLGQATIKRLVRDLSALIDALHGRE